MIRRATVLTVLCAFLAAPLHAQTVAVAQLSGTVADETGAALPGAEVKVTHADTGFSRFVITDTRGDYVFNNLPVGPYRLDVKLDGFTGYEQTGIVLTVGAAPRINVTLKIGSVTETVKVEAAATMVETRSTSVGQVINQEQMVGLPLNGRQPTQLVLLSGAAVSANTGNLIGSQRQYPSAVAISVAGGSSISTHYLLDGGYNNDPLANVGQPMPFPDALQEFRVESGVRPARYGMYNGATVNAVTKAGTNVFHGNVFEFIRHHAFNSIGYFDVQDDGLKRNQSGGTLGGPLIKDKLFFFGAAQITNERVRPTVTNTFVPTARMLAGDFTEVMSAQCRGGRDRTLGAPFVNNRIEPRLFHPMALKIVSQLPVSTDPCGRYSFAMPNNSDEIQGVVRGDYNLNSSQRLFGRYFVANYDRAPGYDGKNLLLASGNGLGLDNRVQTLALGHDYTITSHLIAATRFSLARSRVLRIQGDGLPTWTMLGANVYQYTNGNGDNFFNLSVTDGWPGPAFPGTFISNTPQLSEDIDWVKGAHSLSFGAMWVRPFLDPDGPFQANGIFNFNGSRTRGSTAQDQLGMADFLVGLSSQFTQGGSQLVTQKMHYFGAYLQDVWRVNTRLTVNGGLRWEPYFAPTDLNGFQEAFNLDWFTQNRHSTVLPQAPAGLMFPGDEGFPTNGGSTNNRWAQFAPRLGLVWDPAGNNVQTVRAAIGMYYDSPKLWTYGRYPQNPPFGNTISLINPPSFSDPWAGYPGGSPFPIHLPPDQSTRFPVAAQYASMLIPIHPGEMTQWNIAYERQFWRSWMASATYLGNHGSHMWLGRELNPAIYVAGASTTGNTQARRLFNQLNPSQGQYYASVSIVDDTGTSNYHGLLLALQKRMTDGWSINGNVTLSRCVNYGDVVLDIGNSYPDPNDRNSNKGPCVSDRPYIFNLSTILISRGLGSGFVHALTNAWQLGTVLQMRSGIALTPSTSGDLALTGLGNQRPIVVGDWKLDHPTFDRWFNTDAFAANPPGSWGNAARGLIRGPSYWNVDLALSRNLALAAARRLELRVEAFNVFNHIVPGNPNVTFGNANFGKVTSTGGDPRIMQFAIKFGF